MQLLKITSNPIKYSYEIEHAKLEAPQLDSAKAKIKRDPMELGIQTRHIKVNLDTRESFRSMGNRSTEMMLSDEATKGSQAVEQSMGDVTRDANALADPHDGISVPEIVRNRVSKGYPGTYQTFIPSVPPQISWDGPEIDMMVEPGKVEVDWQMAQNVMNYVPGTFALTVTEYPNVSIEYLGGFNYVPPSADPNYEE